MFAKTIIDSDAFLDMPVTARLLYYDLSMRADDDGFVNSPKKIMRMVGASQDDLMILAARKFIIPFDSGVVVIKHWRIHNYIRKDTYRETQYTEEKSMLEQDKNGAYSLSVDEPWTSRGRAVDTGKDIDRLGKDIDSIRDITPPNPPKRGKRFTPPTVDEVRAYCRERSNNVDAEKFVDFYTAKGWKVGKNPMKDWKAAVRTWERRATDAPQTSTFSSGMMQRPKDDVAKVLADLGNRNGNLI